jgi:hypothetical protein
MEHHKLNIFFEEPAINLFSHPLANNNIYGKPTR